MAEVIVAMGSSMAALFSQVSGVHDQVTRALSVLTAFNWSGSPTTTEVSLPANTTTWGMTATNAESDTFLGHPRVSLTVRTYHVVCRGSATGWRVLESKRLLSGVHV